MKYFIPDIRLATELPPQRKHQDKLGGQPWGLPAHMWPKCSACGRSQSLLAQFEHDAVRLDLGNPGRILFVFQCNHDPGMCPTWEGGGGANACFVVETEQLIDGLAPLPADHPGGEREVRVLRWLEREDGVSSSDAAAFFDERSYGNLQHDVLLRVRKIRG